MASEPTSAPCAAAARPRGPRRSAAPCPAAPAPPPGRPSCGESRAAPPLSGRGNASRGLSGGAKKSKGGGREIQQKERPAHGKNKHRNKKGGSGSKNQQTKNQTMTKKGGNRCGKIAKKESGPNFCRSTQKKRIRTLLLGTFVAEQWAAFREMVLLVLLGWTPIRGFPFGFRGIEALRGCELVPLEVEHAPKERRQTWDRAPRSPSHLLPQKTGKKPPSFTDIGNPLKGFISSTARGSEKLWPFRAKRDPEQAVEGESGQFPRNSEETQWI